MKYIVIEARREHYGMDSLNINNTMTVAELKELLEDCDDDALVVLSHDGGYTYGGVRETLFDEIDTDEDGE